MSLLVRVTDLTVGPKSHTTDRLKNHSTPLEALRLTSLILLTSAYHLLASQLMSSPRFGHDSARRVGLLTLIFACAAITLGQERTPQTSEEYFERGLARYKNGNLQEAENDFTEAITLKNRLALAFYIEESSKHETATPKRNVEAQRAGKRRDRRKKH